MTLATGVGSMPGADDAAFREAVKLVADTFADLPYLPELPGRGPASSMTGRTLGLVAELGADLQPAGWRLTGGQAPAGVDQRRARSQLGQDLDTVEELLGDHAGRFKVQVGGPWTMAATVEKPRGDRVLADVGARRELGQALAEGIGSQIADLRRRLPGAEVMVQVDEPALPAVLTGGVPTASGFHRHRSVDAPAASALLEDVLAAVRSAGAEPVVHCCAAGVPVGLLVGAGAVGVSVDLDRLDATGYDAVADVLDGGLRLLLGVLPTSGGTSEGSGAGREPTEKAVVGRVERFLDMLGLDPETVADRLVLTPACGLAGADPAYARRALELCRSAAAELTP